ncbi:MAG TPA: thiol-activated cytolysin family protein [Hanamia sp.]
MKKLFIVFLLVSFLSASSFGQVMQKTIQSKTSVKTVHLQPASSAAKPPLVVKPVAASVAKPVAASAVKIFVPLSSHSDDYRRYIAKSNANLPAGFIKKMFAYSKTYTYSDGTKVHVYLINKNSGGQTMQTNGVTPKVVSQNSSGSDAAMDCTTTNVQLSATSDNFMNNNYSSQASFIYPGAIYSYDNLFDGNFREESNGRNPIIVTTNNTNISGNSYEIVQQPNQVNITNAITKLFQRFSSVSAANESTSMRIYEANNSADLNMKLGVDASGYGANFDGYIGQQKSEKTEYLTVDCIKTLFSISVAIPDSGYFKTNPGGDSHLLVIGTVNYGVRVLANVRIVFQSEQDEAGFNAGYSGFGVSANVDFNFLSSNSSTQSTINAYYVGGPSSYTTAAFDKTQLENQITQYLQNANYQNAVPISYELYDLNNNMMSNRSATDAFSVPLCVPKATDNAVLDCSGNSNDANATYAYIKTGNNSGDNKDPDTHWSFGIFDGNGNSVASFHDDSNNDPYNNGSTTNHLFVNMQKQSIFSDFKSGGRIHINIAPNGHDTWNMDEFTVYMNFTNPSITQKLTWTGVSLNESARDVDLHFHYDQNSNTLQADAYN